MGLVKWKCDVPHGTTQGYLYPEKHWSRMSRWSMAKHLHHHVVLDATKVVVDASS
jgi:hypothetical protein